MAVGMTWPVSRWSHIPERLKLKGRFGAVDSDDLGVVNASEYLYVEIDDATTDER